ncbi:MAG: IS1595 family transposase, partial [Bacteroidota bacterium]
NCQQKSAWLFKAKLQEAMKSSGAHPLEDQVEVDEFLVGGLEKEKRGRSHGKKRLVVLAIERVTNKKGKETLGRAYSQTIVTSSAEELADFIDQRVDENADITTDGWRGYAPLKGVWKLKQKKSEAGENFSLLHIHIMNIKSWLRGIHHKCSAHRLQKYLDEYHFRFNRRGFLDSIFHKLIERVVLSLPMPYSKIKLCELNG